MLVTVLHDGVPVGSAELSAGELGAGRLAPMPGFARVAATVRAGSAALLELGFFGAAAQRADGRAGALEAAAGLRFDLIDIRGEQVSADFVNLIEAPDGGIVVLARFRGAHAAVGAAVTPPPRADETSA